VVGGIVLVERDAESDLDVPAGDADFFDDEPNEFLALLEVESVEGGAGGGGESADSSVESVAGGQVGALAGEGVALGVEGGAPVVELSGAALQFDQLDEAGLVEVGEAVAFSLGRLGACGRCGRAGRRGVRRRWLGCWW